MSEDSHQINRLIKNFKTTFLKDPKIIIQAPGRVNLIGEHTDYNEGYVLPAAIDKYLYIGFNKRVDNIINIFAIDINKYYVGTTTDKIGNQGWANFFIGILNVLHEKGCAVGGFDCCFYSTIPIGAGLSSSSALECGILAGLNQMNNFGFTNMQLILLSQKSNHERLGILGGIMDQYICFFGQAGSAILLDCKTFISRSVEIELDQHEFLLFNTQVRHEHAVGNYNNGPFACKKAVTIIQQKYKEVKSLRDVDYAMLSTLKMPSRLLNMVKFVLKENQRVLQFTAALESANFEHIGKLMFESHAGLKLEYKVSCSELDFLVEMAIKENGILGSRMMGGGFGGCTINLINKSRKSQIIKSLKSSYKDKYGLDLINYNVVFVDGLKIF